MAQVLFKRGLASALASLTPQDGVFYLTTDTNRLYVGKTDSSGDGYLAEINRYIQNIASLANLPRNPAKGDFVWVEDQDALLACKNPTAAEVQNRWVCLNGSTGVDADTFVSGISTPEISSSSSGGITVSFNIEQTKIDPEGGQTALTDIPVSFTISKDDLKTVHEVAVGLNASNVTDGAKIALSGTGLANSGTEVQIKGGSNAQVTINNGAVEISSTDTTYSLGAESTGIVLTASSGGKDTVPVIAGNDAILTDVSAASGVKISHKAYDTSKSDGTTQFTHGGTFKVIDSLTFDKGHVTGYTERTITAPIDEDTTVAEVTVTAGSDNGNLSVVVKDSNGDTQTGTLEGGLYFTVGSGDGQKVYNQGNLNVYTIPEIDTMLQGIDGMVYRGTINPDAAVSATNKTSLPTTGVKNGDTYKIAKAGTYGGHECDIGDILIATGTEVNGIITGAVAWAYIPSGDDVDTQYTLGLANNTFTLTDSITNGSAGSVTIGAGNTIGVSTSNSTITVAHANVAHTNPEPTSTQVSAGNTFTIVEGVTVNEQGHVTGISRKNIQLPTDDNTTYGISVDAGDGTKQAIKLTDSDGGSTEVGLANGTDIVLTADEAQDKITVAHRAYSTPTQSNGTAKKPSHGGTFSIIDGITVSNGHVTGYQTTQVELPLDENTIYTLSGAASNITSGAKYTVTLEDDSHGTNTAEINLKSDTITIAASGNDITANIEWGAF